MPTYTYRCTKCEAVWEDFRTMANREEPCGEPCPKCEATECVEKAVDNISGVKIDTKHDWRNTKNLSAGFKDRMLQIAEGLPVSDGSRQRMRDQYK